MTVVICECCRKEIVMGARNAVSSGNAMNIGTDNNARTVHLDLHAGCLRDIITAISDRFPNLTEILSVVK